MPLYEYECDTCGHRFEVIQKFSDPLVTECPKCQGAVRKLFSSPAIQFKGSGFYITDYARKDSTPAGHNKSEGSGEKSSGASSTSEAGKSDSSSTSGSSTSNSDSSSRETGKGTSSTTTPTTPKTPTTPSS